MRKATRMRSAGVQIIAFCLVLSLAFPLWSQPSANVYAIKDAKIYTLAGPPIEKGVVVIRDGKDHGSGSTTSRFPKMRK